MSTRPTPPSFRKAQSLRVKAFKKKKKEFIGRKHKGIDLDGNNSQREKGPTRGGKRLFVYCGLCLKAGVWEARAALMNWETWLVGCASGEIPHKKWSR